MPQRTSRRLAARVVLLVTLFGLLAMHGLPDAMAAPMAGSGGRAAMTSSVSMSPASAPAPMTGAHRRAQVTADDSRPPDRSSAAAVGCGMDHGNCVAVLREAAGHRGVPAVSGVVTAPGTPTPAAWVPTPTQSLRAPPDVSLIGLGISRT